MFTLACATVRHSIVARSRSCDLAQSAGAAATGRAVSVLEAHSGDSIELVAMRNEAKRLGRLLAMALAAALAGCGVNEQDDLEPGSSWIPADIAGADLDGDGRTDVVSVAALQPRTGASTGHLRIHRQSATGGFTTTQIAVGRHPARVRIADVNADGAPDLLVLDAAGTGAASDDVLYLLVQNLGNRGQFQSPRAIASGMTASDFVVTDVDLDGLPDIVVAGVAGGGTGATQLLQNASQRGFFRAPTTLAIAGRPQRLAVGDVRALGRADLVSYAALDDAAGGSPGQLVVNAATSQAGVAASGGYEVQGAVLASHAGVRAQALAVADVDADGRADIVAAFAAASATYAPKLSVVLQRPGGGDVLVDTGLAGLSGVDAFAIADLNGDGVPDVATTGVFASGGSGTQRSRTNVLAPTAAGGYALVAAIDMPVAMARIAAADVDGDGLVDLLLLGERNRAFVMRQSAAARGTFLAPREL